MHWIETLQLKTPQMIVDLAQVRRNVEAMVRRAQACGIVLRPHFKTHQCAAIGEIFRAFGVEKITVSSLGMARYFADHGWGDITLAVPINPAQAQQAAALAQEIKLNLLVDSFAGVDALKPHLKSACSIWIKVDVGYGRVGISWENKDAVASLAREIMQCEPMRFEGLLTHSGHSYNARGTEEIQGVYVEGRERMLGVQSHLAARDIEARLSFGDTPSCSTREDFDGFDEMRPGNFVFYDLVQSQIGSCAVDDIAVATACPVLGVYPDSGKIAIYGGSVHLSKDSMIVDGERLFGRLAQPAEAGWRVLPLDEAKVVTCCQEVSTLRVTKAVMDQMAVGQFVLIVPVHACLAAEMNSHYLTTDGHRLDRFVLKA